jgi:hypothetical protein
LVAKAQEIALRYPQNEISRYQSAANTLRLPYWDWALSANLPPVVTSPTVQVRTPGNGTMETITNPLFDYDYPTAMESGQFGAYDGGDRTFRCDAGTANSVLSSSELGPQVVSGEFRAVFRRHRVFG